MYESGVFRRSDGQESNPATFSRFCWAKPTARYLVSVKSRDRAQWDVIYEAAQQLNIGKGGAADPIMIDESDSDNDPRTLIEDDD